MWAQLSSHIRHVGKAAKILNLLMANLNNFLREAKEMHSETKENKGGGEVKTQQNGHSFALQFGVLYATIGKHFAQLLAILVHSLHPHDFNLNI
jgi:phage antirepressor YoqD-like protein